MLHLQTTWHEGTKSLDVEYTTPLEECKRNNYQITLHSLYSGAIETNSVSVPVKCDIQDSSYISSIDTDEINYTNNIKSYSEKITKLLNGQGEGIHERSSKEFKKILTNNTTYPPCAIFNDNSQDYYSL